MAYRYLNRKCVLFYLCVQFSDHLNIRMQTLIQAERSACTPEWWSLMTHKWSHVHSQMSSGICYLSWFIFSSSVRFWVRQGIADAKILQAYIGVRVRGLHLQRCKMIYKVKTDELKLYNKTAQLLGICHRPLLLSLIHGRFLYIL